MYEQPSDSRPIEPKPNRGDGEDGRQTERNVLGILADRSPRNVLAIATMLDRHPITVDLACARLDEQGYVYPLGEGRYKITENGTQRIGDTCDI